MPTHTSAKTTIAVDAALQGVAGIYDIYQASQAENAYDGAGYIGSALLRLFGATTSMMQAARITIPAKPPNNHVLPAAHPRADRLPHELPDLDAPSNVGRGLVEGAGDVLNAPRSRMWDIPNRIVREEVTSYIARVKGQFEAAGGKIVMGGPRPSPTGGYGVINVRTKTMTLYDGYNELTVVEELGHFKQAVRDGYWGKGGVPAELGGPTGLWER